ncbi:MerR family transcriptional regulator [Clostridium tyrobutyricum]|uniref:MerR family transcriptional regulator n=1 Tax=Clostridium tyrobutyricum TaxID=1519 RepID=UPI0011C74A15|nr:MerR family transcriptional regulator [Clostridium tyrobutyricum]
MNTNDEAENQSETEQKFINGEVKTFKTGDVAKILNETTAMIRVYCRDFSEFLKLDHKPGEHRTFNKKHIEILKYIIYLLKEKNYTTKQAKEYLTTPEGKLMQPITDDKERMTILLDMLGEKIRPIIKEEVSTLIQSNNKNHQKINDKLDNIEAIAKDKIGYVIKSTEALKNSISKINEIEKQNEERSKRVEELISDFRNKNEKEIKKKRSFIFPFFKK